MKIVKQMKILSQKQRTLDILTISLILPLEMALEQSHIVVLITGLMVYHLLQPII